MYGSRQASKAVYVETPMWQDTVFIFQIIFKIFINSINLVLIIVLMSIFILVEAVKRKKAMKVVINTKITPMACSRFSWLGFIMISSDRFNFVTIFFTIIVEIVVVLVSNSKNHLKQLHMKFSRDHLDIAFNIWFKITLFTSQVLVTYWLFCLKVFTTTVTFIHGYPVYWWTFLQICKPLFSFLSSHRGGQLTFNLKFIYLASQWNEQLLAWHINYTQSH